MLVTVQITITRTGSDSISTAQVTKVVKADACNPTCLWLVRRPQ